MATSAVREPRLFPIDDSARDVVDLLHRLLNGWNPERDCILPERLRAAAKRKAPPSGEEGGASVLGRPGASG